MDEAQFEAAEALQSSERDRAVARIRSELDGPGSDDCQDCGDTIPKARRIALPSARRCAPCQSRIEEETCRRARHR